LGSAASADAIVNRGSDSISRRRRFSSPSSLLSSRAPACAWPRCARGSVGEEDERERYRRSAWMETQATTTKARRPAMMRREVSKEVLAAESDGGAAGSAASVYGGGGDGKREAITREA
jgi:hypothetical protein